MCFIIVHAFVSIGHFEYITEIQLDIEAKAEDKLYIENAPYVLCEFIHVPLLKMCSCFLPLCLI